MEDQAFLISEAEPKTGGVPANRKVRISKHFCTSAALCVVLVMLCFACWAASAHDLRTTSRMRFTSEVLAPAPSPPQPAFCCYSALGSSDFCGTCNSRAHITNWCAQSQANCEQCCGGAAAWCVTGGETTSPSPVPATVDHYADHSTANPAPTPTPGRAPPGPTPAPASPTPMPALAPTPSNMTINMTMTHNWDCRLKTAITDAVQITLNTAKYLEEHLKHVQETAAQARKEIDAWSEDKIAKSNKELDGFLQDMAEAAFRLTSFEVDLKTWCFTQHGLFKTIHTMLEDKLSKAGPHDITSEYKLLKRTVAIALTGLKEMENKIDAVEAAFHMVSVKAKNLAQEYTEEQSQIMSQLKHHQGQVSMADFVCQVTAGAAATGGILIPETGGLSLAVVLIAGSFSAACAVGEQIAIHDIEDAAQTAEKKMKRVAESAMKNAERAKRLRGFAAADYEEMKGIEGRLATILPLTITIKDPGSFRDEVLPRIANLVKLLESDGKDNFSVK